MQFKKINGWWTCRARQKIGVGKSGLPFDGCFGWGKQERQKVRIIRLREEFCAKGQLLAIVSGYKALERFKDNQFSIVHSSINCSNKIK